MSKLHRPDDSSLPVLPFDIFEVIFKTLSMERDLPTLKLCALTQRSFCSTCHRHVFSAIELDVVKLDQLQALEELLRDNQTIALYVNALDLHLVVYQYFPQDSGFFRPAFCQYLLRILVQLPNIQSLVLFTPYTKDGVDWVGFGDELRTSLENIIQTPKLRLLDLRSTTLKNFPISSMLARMPNLVDLRLGEFHGEAGIDLISSEIVSHPVPELNCLYLPDCAHLHSVIALLQVRSPIYSIIGTEHLSDLNLAIWSILGLDNAKGILSELR